MTLSGSFPRSARLSAAAWLLLCAAPLAAQSNIESVYKLTSQLVFPKVMDWKARKGDVDRGQDPSLDDTQWENFDYQPVLGADQCWLRALVTLPGKIALQPVDRRKVWLRLEVLGTGKVYLDGKEAGAIRPGENRILLFGSAAPGAKIKVALNLRGEHQKVIFREAVLELDPWRSAVKEAADLRLVIFTASRILGTDTRQKTYLLETDPGIDRSTVPGSRKQVLFAELERALAGVDQTAVAEGDPDRFVGSVRRSYSRMDGLAEHLRSYTLYLISNAHIDLAWLWRWRETVEVAHDTFSGVLGLMDKYPDLVFAQSQAQLYEWMRIQYPDLFERIRRKAAQGNWEIVGGMWVEPDCNLISGESWVRQILYGKRFFEKYFGAEVKIGWNPDSFGYNWNMPQFFSRSGITSFITQKLLWNDTNLFPYHLFWWKGPDGSRILVYMPYTGYTNVVEPYQMVDDLRQFEANTGLRSLAVLIGYGDHGGGPEEDMLQRARSLQSLPVFPRVKFGTAAGYLASIPDSVKERLPELDNELYLEYHRGTYTSQARMKKLNRGLETALENAEKLSSLESLVNGRSAYPWENLEEAWKKVLFNQMHDILPGSGIAGVYHDAVQGYERAAFLCDQAVLGAMLGLAGRINTADGAPGEPVVVFNTLAWPRSGVASLPGLREVLEHYQVFDWSGSRVESQVVDLDQNRAALLFLARDVPSAGYKVFKLRRSPTPAGRTVRGKLGASPLFLENDFLRVELDHSSGLVTRVFDKRSRREALLPGGRGNLIELYEDRPKQWDAWNIGYTGQGWKLERADKVELTESGPVRATLTVKKSFLGATKTRYQLAGSFPSSFFTQEISLYADLPILEVRTRVDWWEDQVLCKVSWEVNSRADTAYYEIPMAAIGRPAVRNNSYDRARFEVPALRWADLGDSLSGVSLLSDSKYGYDVEGSRMRLTLLKSPVWPDRSADRGTHFIRYALYPHDRDWRLGGTVRMAGQFCNPLLVHRGVSHRGVFPVQGMSFFRAEPENVVLSAFKLAEDRDGYVLRCYEAHGKPARAEITLPAEIRSAVETDLLERGSLAVPVQGQTLGFDIRPFEIKTFRITFNFKSFP